MVPVTLRIFFFSNSSNDWCWLQAQETVTIHCLGIAFKSEINSRWINLPHAACTLHIVLVHQFLKWTLKQQKFLRLQYLIECEFNMLCIKIADIETADFMVWGIGIFSSTLYQVVQVNGCFFSQCDNYEIRPGKHLGVCISVANNRLFVGSIPKNKTKENILEEFSKVTGKGLHNKFVTLILKYHWTFLLHLYYMTYSGII